MSLLKWNESWYEIVVVNIATTLNVLQYTWNLSISMAATVNRQWRLNGFTGFDSLVLKEDRIPEIGDSDVLVRWKYASLNYRDLVVSKVLLKKQTKGSNKTGN